MRKRLVLAPVLAVAGGLLALYGGAGAYNHEPVNPPPNAQILPFTLTGQVVGGKLIYELEVEGKTGLFEVVDARAQAVWKKNEMVVEFKINARLRYGSPGGGGFESVGVNGELKEGTGFDIREFGWRADKSLEQPRSIRVDVAGIVTPTMFGGDESFALLMELPAVMG